MARTRSTHNRNLSASRHKKFKNEDESASVQWLNLHNDVLFLILMKLSLIDFISFRCVCKAWRSLAYSYKNIFLESRKPMVVKFSPHAKRACYLFDIFEDRKFKTILPDFSGRRCLGLACGYLIMLGQKKCDFWLVNPITRLELRFPILPSFYSFNTKDFKATLVFSPSAFGYAFVVTFSCSSTILVSLPMKEPNWKSLSSRALISDIHAFNGKIYVLHIDSALSELRLGKNPSLTPIEVKNDLKVYSGSHKLISLDEKLFVFDSGFPTFEFDFNKMEWVESDLTHVEEIEFLLSKLNCRADWIDAFLQNELRKRDGSIFWYFPDECYKVNFLDE